MQDADVYHVYLQIVKITPRFIRLRMCIDHLNAPRIEDRCSDMPSFVSTGARIYCN